MTHVVMAPAKATAAKAAIVEAAWQRAAAEQRLAEHSSSARVCTYSLSARDVLCRYGLQ